MNFLVGKVSLNKTVSCERWSYHCDVITQSVCYCWLIYFKEVTFGQVTLQSLCPICHKLHGTYKRNVSGCHYQI